ncbi:MAG TPA: hypothetical protein VGE52_08845 [Pirellulales bacterium]
MSSAAVVAVQQDDSLVAARRTAEQAAERAKAEFLAAQQSVHAADREAEAARQAAEIARQELEEARRSAEAAERRAERESAEREAVLRQAVRAAGDADRARIDRYLTDVEFVNRQPSSAPFLDLLAEPLPTGDQPDIRGFAWFWLWAKGLPTIARFPRAPSKNGLNLEASAHDRLALSPNGATLVIAEPSGIVVRDVAVRSVQHSLPFGRRPVAVSPDGKLLVARRVTRTGKDDGLQIWDLQTGAEGQRLAATLDVEADAPGWLAFDPTSDRLLVAQATRLSLWSTTTGEKLVEQSSPDTVLAVTFTNDGAILAALPGGSVLRWKWQEKRVERLTPPKKRDAPNDVAADAFCALSPDGRRIAVNVASPNAEPGLATGVAVVDLVTGSRTVYRYALAATDATAERLTFTPDGRRLTALVRFVSAKGRTERFAQVWDLASSEGRVIAPEVEQQGASGRTPDSRAIAAAADFPVEIALSRDGSRLAVLGSEETRIVAYGPPREPPLVVDEPFSATELLLGDRGPVVGGQDARLSTDGRWIAVIGRSGAAVWDGQRRAWTQRRAGLRLPFAFSPNTPVIAAASSLVEDEIVLWNFRDGKETKLRTLATPSAIAFGPGGDVVAVGNGLLPWQLFDVSTQRVLTGFRDEASEPAFEAPCRRLTFTADGRRVISAHSNKRSSETTGVIRVWDSATGRVERLWRCDLAHIVDLAASPDGELIAAAGSGGGVWDLNGQLLLRRKEPWSSVEFAPDGRTLSYVSRGKLYLYDVRTARFSARPLTDLGEGSAVEFFPDGRAIAVAKRVEQPAENGPASGPVSSIEIVRPASDSDLESWRNQRFAAAGEASDDSAALQGRVPSPLAGERFRRAFEREDWAAARKELREVFDEMGPFAHRLASVEEWRHFVAASPTTEACYLLAQHYADAGDWSAAEENLLNAIRENPALSDAWFDLALVHLAKGDDEGYHRVAREMFERFIVGSGNFAQDAHDSALVLRAAGLGLNTATRLQPLTDYLRRLNRISPRAGEFFAAQWAYSLGRFSRDGQPNDAENLQRLLRVLPWERVLQFGLNTLAARARVETDRQAFAALRREIAERGFATVWRQALAEVDPSSEPVPPPIAGLPGDWLLGATARFREGNSQAGELDLASATAWQALMTSERFAFIRRQFTWQEEVEWQRLFAQAEAAKKAAEKR